MLFIIILNKENDLNPMNKGLFTFKISLSSKNGFFFI